MIRRAIAWDMELYDRIHRGRLPAPLEWALPRLSRGADKSAIWMASAAALALCAGHRGRDTARDGMAAVAVCSALVNGPAKWTVRRRRPDMAAVAPHRLLRRVPASTSFPSGHAASSAAFATAVSLDWPAIGLPLTVLAGAIAYSRVHTGVHYPGDVMGGMAIGAGIAAALHRWRRRQS